MLATGNPYIKEKMDLDIQVQKLKMLKSNFLSEKYGLEDKVIKFYPMKGCGGIQDNSVSCRAFLSCKNFFRNFTKASFILDASFAPA